MSQLPPVSARVFSPQPPMPPSPKLAAFRAVAALFKPGARVGGVDLNGANWMSAKSSTLAGVDDKFQPALDAARIGTITKLAKSDGPVELGQSLDNRDAILSAAALASARALIQEALIVNRVKF